MTSSALDSGPTRRQRATKALTEFMKMESAGGVLLLVTAIMALMVANSPLSAL